MWGMSDFDLTQFSALLSECRDLYVSSGELCAKEHPEMLPRGGQHFVQLMDDLHRALVVKVFISICEADRRWSMKERMLAIELVDHLWGERLDGEKLKQVVKQMSSKAMSLKWYSVIRPFDQIAPLRNRVGQLETLVTRLANFIARIDGPPAAAELGIVKTIQDELYLHLRQIPIDEPDQHEAAARAQKQTIDTLYREVDTLPNTAGGAAVQTQSTTRQRAHQAIDAEQLGEAVETKSSEELLEEALAELDQLVGLNNIKHEVRTLTNFLKVQSQREQAGLPSTPLSLHMVFNGNPGTGKTTIARILGRIFGAMGILNKGHIIETDRSGLVAGYAGQTSIKTDELVQEALDGVMFIDEAYALVAADNEDAFGQEAIQALLKRMEDERERLVVILAGYPTEMKQLLSSNPGLSSRFSRNLTFEDYSPRELCEIFGRMCQANHYSLPASTRAKLIVGFHLLWQARDRHFGNGRAVRNLFEHSIRRMANRIVQIADLSVEQLTTLEPEDIEFRSLTSEQREGLADYSSRRFHITCPECQHGNGVNHEFLGRRVRCPKCKREFAAEWGDVAE